jgi:hypothetical protein
MSAVSQYIRFALRPPNTSSTIATVLITVSCLVVVLASLAMTNWLNAPVGLVATTGFGLLLRRDFLHWREKRESAVVDRAR